MSDQMEIDANARQISTHDEGQDDASTTQGGGSIGEAGQNMEVERGWQEARGKRAGKRVQGGSTGASPAKPDAQRRAVVVEASEGGGNIAQQQISGDEAATTAKYEMGVEAAGKGQQAQTAAPQRAPAAAARATQVGGSIENAASITDASTIAPELAWQVRQLHLLLIIIILPVAASYRSCRGSGSGSRSSVATLRKGLAASDRCRLAPQCAGHASDGVADPGGNSLSEGLITKIIRRFAVSALLCCVMRVMWDVRRSGEHGTRVCRPGKSAGGRWARTVRRRDKMSGSSQGVAAESSRRKAQVHSRRRGRGTCDSSREKLFHPYAVKGGKSCHHLNLFLVQRMRWMRSGPNGRNG